jgi:hypothetical protein
MPLPNRSKYLAIGTFDQAATPQQLDAFMSREVPATLKLYIDGKMEQFWLRHDGKGVVFIMTTDTAAEADGLLKALPLGRAGLLHFDLIPIGTLTAFRVLMGDKFSLAT